MSRRIKGLMIREFADRFSGLQQNGCVVVGLTGLSAEDSTELRGLLSEKGARMMVVRNRLFAIALDELGLPELKQLLDGAMAVISGQSPVQAAKAAEDVAENFKCLNVVGGYAEGHILDRAGVERLASLPDRQTLLAQSLSCMCSPALRFVSCLQGTLQRLAAVLDQLRESRRGETSAG